MAQFTERFIKVAANNVEVYDEISTPDVAGGTRIVLKRRDSYGQAKLDTERARHDADLLAANRINATQFKADAIATRQAEVARQQTALDILDKITLTDANGNTFEAFDEDAELNFEAAGFGTSRFDRAEVDLAAEQAETAAEKKQAEIDKVQARIDRLDLIQAAMDGPITPAAPMAGHLANSRHATERLSGTFDGGLL